MSGPKPKVKDVVARMKADALLGEGHDAHASGDRAKALRLYRRAAALAPDWAVPHYNIGFVFNNKDA